MYKFLSHAVKLPSIDPRTLNYVFSQNAVGSKVFADETFQLTFCRNMLR